MGTINVRKKMADSEHTRVSKLLFTEAAVYFTLSEPRTVIDCFPMLVNYVRGFLRVKNDQHRKTIYLTVRGSESVK